MRERRTPVHEAALRLGLPVQTPPTLRTPESQALLSALDADLAVVGAYGLILPRPILDAPRLGCINLHASLLPRWRGAAPIQRAILAGDRESGLSIFQMEEGLDTGPVLAMRSLPIGPRTTADELHDGLAALAVAMLPDGAGRDRGGHAHRDAAADRGGHLRHEDPQGRGPARLLAPGGRARPTDTRPVASARVLLLDRRRAPSHPRGPAHRRDGACPARSLELPLTIACGAGALQVLRVQRAGRKPMTAAELQRGFPIPVGKRLA